MVHEKIVKDLIFYGLMSEGPFGFKCMFLLGVCNNFTVSILMVLISIQELHRCFQT